MNFDLVGEDIEVSLQPDPLVIHYRQENIELQAKNVALEDKVKNLEETLIERSHLDGLNPCDGIEYIKVRMQSLREDFEREKNEY